MPKVIEPFDPKDVVARPEHYFRRAYVWELPVRITHWVSAVCVTTLFLTGLYIGSPILTSSGEPANHFLMGRIRQIHFAAALIFLLSFLLRVYWFWAGNNYARSGFPMVWRKTWWTDLFQQARDYLRLQRGRAHLGHNALGGSAYTFFVVFLGWVQIFTGLALYSETNPNGLLNKFFGWVIPLRQFLQHSHASSLGGLGFPDLCRPAHLYRYLRLHPVRQRSDHLDHFWLQVLSPWRYSHR